MITNVDKNNENSEAEKEEKLRLVTLKQIGMICANFVINNGCLVS
jgi:hypothetical protein